MIFDRKENWCQEIVAGTVTRLRFGKTRNGGLFPFKEREFSLLRSVLKYS
jgi:hypothetical protein